MFFKISILAVGVLVAFGSAARRPGATYLLIPVGARQSGIAYAFTAVADDASANYYNAAGLAFLDSPQITGIYLGYLLGLHPDMHHVYVAAAYPFGKSCVGLDFTYFNMGGSWYQASGGIPWRTTSKISYARLLNRRLAIGISWKFIKQQYFSQWVWDPRLSSIGIDQGGTGTSWAFDANLLWRIVPRLTIGSVLHNIGPSIAYEEDRPFTGSSDPLPRTFRLGLAYRPIQTDEISILISGELTKVLVGMFADESKSFWQHVGYEFDEAWKAIGLEVTIYKIVSLRGGFFYDKEGVREGLTFGAGVSYMGLSLDIGIDEHVYEFETENRRISLSYKF